MHLRRCAQCGHVGCCDTSPAQHASAHFGESGHAVVQSFEPGEDWFWDYAKQKGVIGPPLEPPTSRPEEQPRARARSHARDVTSAASVPDGIRHLHSWPT